MNKNITFGWRKGYVLSATFLLALLVITASCKKDSKLLGGNVIDQNDLLNSGGVDTFMLKTFTILEDSAITGNPRYALLGTYNDPEFGFVDASFYTQARLSGLNPNFGTDPAQIFVDSFILALEYVNSYGSVSNQIFEVYEVDQEMSLDSTYYQFSTLPVKPENLVNTSSSIAMNPDAITVVGDDTVSTQLRIPLKTTKAKAIIDDAISGAFATEFGDDDLFVKNYFKGIQVKTSGAIPSSGNGTVGYFNLFDQDSKLIIYYREGSDPTPRIFDLRINDKCASFNHVVANNTGKFVQTVINDTISGQTEFYAQSNKSRAVIDLPTLKNLPKNIVVHTAVLYLPVQHQLTSDFAPSGNITVLTAKSFNFVANGTYSPTGREYAINIREFVQAYVIGGYTSSELLISPSAFVSSVDRIVFNGPNSSNKEKPRLVLTYTEF